MSRGRALPALFAMLSIPGLAACGEFAVDDQPSGVAAAGAGADAVVGAGGSTIDIEVGPRLATELSCRSCHSIDGSRGVGPTWLGLAGSTETLIDGSIVTVDRAYLERSIREPEAEIVAGFDVVEMPSLELEPEEVDALVGYIESLG